MTNDLPEGRYARRAELSRKTKAALAAMCRAGIATPDGGRVIIEGGMHPVSSWSKDDIIASVLSVEFPPDVAE